MPKTCSTCIHWNRLPAGARADGPTGECRERSPSRDYGWPRTKAADFCSCYSQQSEVAYATSDKGAQQLSLVVDPAAPRPTEGKIPPAYAPGEARPRSAKASPKSEAPAPRATGRAGDE